MVSMETLLRSVEAILPSFPYDGIFLYSLRDLPEAAPVCCQ